MAHNYGDKSTHILLFLIIFPMFNNVYVCIYICICKFVIYQFKDDNIYIDSLIIATIKVQNIFC